MPHAGTAPYMPTTLHPTALAIRRRIQSAHPDWSAPKCTALARLRLLAAELRARNRENTMTWMITATGGTYDLLNLDADAVGIQDIAHSLAQLNRYTGACARPYSVAEHSLLVVEIMERELSITDPAALMAGLLHDAHEALVADVSSPMKAALAQLAELDGRKASDWARIEDMHARLIRRRFGVAQASEQHAHAISSADLIALSTEWVYLMPATTALPDTHDTHPPVDWVEIRSRDGMTWADWRDAFIDRYDELVYAINVEVAA